MRKGLPWVSADGETEGDEQAQVEDEVPRGAHLRVHGEHDEQAVNHNFCFSIDRFELKDYKIGKDCLPRCIITAENGETVGGKVMME